VIEMFECAPNGIGAESGRAHVAFDQQAVGALFAHHRLGFLRIVVLLEIYDGNLRAFARE